MNHELAMCFCSMSVGTMTPTSLSSLMCSLPPSGRARAGGGGGGVLRILSEGMIEGFFGV